MAGDPGRPPPPASLPWCLVQAFPPQHLPWFLGAQGPVVLRAGVAGSSCLDLPHIWPNFTPGAPDPAFAQQTRGACIVAHGLGDLPPEPGWVWCGVLGAAWSLERLCPNCTWSGPRAPTLKLHPQPDLA